MQKKRLISFSVALLVVLTLAGCGGAGRDRDQSSSVEYRRGSQGLELRFARNLPPPRIYDDQDFNVMVEVYNRGATTVSGGNSKLFLSGFDQSIITALQATSSLLGSPIGAQEGARVDMEGKSLLNPEGGFDIVEFVGNIRDLESKNIDVYDPTLLATACYRYETLAAPQVCIDGDPFSTASKERVCTPGTVGGGSQGAPVAVSSVDVDARPRATQFKIYIQNVGGGTVFKDGFTYLNKCNPYNGGGLGYKDVDYVSLQEVKVGTTNIKGTCKPVDAEGNIRLTDGSGFIICTLTGINQPVYTTPLRIMLRYGYRQSISQRIEIVATP